MLSTIARLHGELGQLVVKLMAAEGDVERTLSLATDAEILVKRIAWELERIRMRAESR